MASYTLTGARTSVMPLSIRLNGETSRSRCVTPFRVTGRFAWAKTEAGRSEIIHKIARTRTEPSVLMELLSLRGNCRLCESVFLIVCREVAAVFVNVELISTSVMILHELDRGIRRSRDDKRRSRRRD
jgi:hypothetical protein